MKSYTLQSSTDGTTWTGYEENGQVKVVEVKGYIYINGLAHYFKKEKCFCREFFLNRKKKHLWKTLGQERKVFIAYPATLKYFD